MLVKFSNATNSCHHAASVLLLAICLSAGARGFILSPTFMLPQRREASLCDGDAGINHILKRTYSSHGTRALPVLAVNASAQRGVRCLSNKTSDPGNSKPALGIAWCVNDNALLSC